MSEFVEEYYDLHRQEATGGQIKLHDTEFHNLNSSSTKAIKSNRVTAVHGLQCVYFMPLSASKDQSTCGWCMNAIRA